MAYWKSITQKLKKRILYKSFNFNPGLFILIHFYIFAPGKTEEYFSHCLLWICGLGIISDVIVAIDKSQNNHKSWAYCDKGIAHKQWEDIRALRQQLQIDGDGDGEGEDDEERHRDQTFPYQLVPWENILKLTVQPPDPQTPKQWEDNCRALRQELQLDGDGDVEGEEDEEGHRDQTFPYQLVPWENILNLTVQPL